jgi:hypothetical protein
MVVDANQLHCTRSEEEHIGVTIWQHALYPVGVNALLPATSHHLAPRLRRSPLPVDVRFVQDHSSLAQDHSIMEQPASISTVRVEDLCGDLLLRGWPGLAPVFGWPAMVTADITR